MLMKQGVVLQNRAALLSLSSSSSIMNDEPCFFKLILAPRFDLQKLGIPSKFVQKYEGELLDGNVKLNIPSGEVWEVKLVRKDSKVWLQNGWQKLVEFYSISYGHFLVFRYKGNAVFDVVIFDMSASEIEYPVVDIKACRESTKRKRETTSSTPSSKKRVPEKVFGVRCDLTPDERKRVDAYQCKHPSFVVKLRPSQVKNKYLNIPLEFVRKYLKELGKFKLVSVTGKTWSMRSKAVGKTHVQITKGWKHFALYNKLQVGDICVFELINGTTGTMKASILPTERKALNFPEIKMEAD